MSDLDIARLWGQLTAEHIEVQQLEEELGQRKAKMMQTALRLKALCESRTQENLQ